MWQKIKSYFINLRLRSKLTVIIFSVSILLFMVFSVVGLSIVVKSQHALLYSALQDSLASTASTLAYDLNRLAAATYVVATDASVQSHLQLVRDDRNAINLSEAFRGINTVILNQYAQTSAMGAYFISIYSPYTTAHTDTVRANRGEESERVRVRSLAQNAKGRAVWVTDYDSEDVICVARAIREYSPLTLSPLGTVVVGVSLDKLMNSIKGVPQSANVNYYMLTQGGNTLFRSSDLPEGAAKALEGMEIGQYRVISASGHRYFAVRCTVPGYDWEFTHLIPYDDSHRAITISLILYALVGAVCLLCSMLLCNVLFNRITRHIDNLILKMTVFAKDSTAIAQVSYDYTQRGDELGELHRRFDAMANSLIALIQQDYTNQLLMKDAQLKALEAQIDPHFLYNTLESINWRAKAIGEKKISRMVEALGKLLRATLSNSTEHITLKREMELVCNYMMIQQLRFEDRLQFTMDIPAELDGARFPKLTIQPIVENAIRYALEENDETCSITVRAFVEDSLLHVTVHNTGSSFPEDFGEQLAAGNVTGHGFGIGLANIQKRIQLFFGEAYGLTFYNEDNCAVVRISVPYIQDEEQ